MIKDIVGVVGTGTYIPDNYWDAKYCAQLTDGRWTEEAIIEKLESLGTFKIDFWRVSDDASPTEDTTVDKDLAKMTKKELQSLATEKSVEVDGTETKERLIELLLNK